MGTKKKTRAQLEADLKILRSGRVAESVASVLNTLIRYGTLAFIAFAAWQSIEALAGKKTGADIGVKFLGDISISNAVAWLFGGAGVLYGTRERKLRKDHIERTAHRLEEFEKIQDPNRTSSGLTHRGETHPKDTL